MDTVQPDPDGLTLKQRAFVDAYCGRANGNATRAARLAGYSESALHVQGHDNLRNPKVHAAIKSVMQLRAMPDFEVTYRLAEHARAEYTDYLRDDGSCDLAGLRAAGLMRLVKSVQQLDGGRVKVEFHDPQTALINVAKLNGQYKEILTATVHHTGLEKLTDDELRDIADGKREG